MQLQCKKLSNRKARRRSAQRALTHLEKEKVIERALDGDATEHEELVWPTSRRQSVAVPGSRNRSGALQ